MEKQRSCTISSKYIARQWGQTSNVLQFCVHWPCMCRGEELRFTFTFSCTFYGRKLVPMLSNNVRRSDTRIGICRWKIALFAMLIVGVLARNPKTWIFLRCCWFESHQEHLFFVLFVWTILLRDLMKSYGRATRSRKKQTRCIKILGGRWTWSYKAKPEISKIEYILRADPNVSGSKFAKALRLPVLQFRFHSDGWVQNVFLLF